MTSWLKVILEPFSQVKYDIKSSISDKKNIYHITFLSYLYSNDKELIISDMKYVLNSHFKENTWMVYWNNDQLIVSINSDQIQHVLEYMGDDDQDDQDDQMKDDYLLELDQEDENLSTQMEGLEINGIPKILTVNNYYSHSQRPWN